MATLIFKPTEKCNSNCVYCDVVHKQDTAPNMPLELLEKLFIRIDEYLKACPKERMQVIWHGGAPMLLGQQYFEAAWNFQSQHCQETSPRIEHSIQSNLTLFREELIPSFRKLGITNIGSSFDPEPHIRGPGKHINSLRYNKLFMYGDSLATRHGMSSGIIYVVTKKSLKKPLEVFFFLTNLKLGRGINLNPVLVYDPTRKEIAVTPEEYVEFLGSIFPTWWKHQDRYPDIEPFRSLVKNIRDKECSLGCVDSGNCAYSHVYVGPNGKASHCGRSADWNLLSYGTIQEHSFMEIFSNGQREQLLQRNEILQNGECQGCRFWSICHGGCPLDAYSQYQDFLYKTEWCEAKRRFLECYFEPITGLRYEPPKP